MLDIFSKHKSICSNKYLNTFQDLLGFSFFVSRFLEVALIQSVLGTFILNPFNIFMKI